MPRKYISPSAIHGIKQSSGFRTKNTDFEKVDYLVSLKNPQNGKPLICIGQACQIVGIKRHTYVQERDRRRSNKTCMDVGRPRFMKPEEEKTYFDEVKEFLEDGDAITVEDIVSDLNRKANTWRRVGAPQEITRFWVYKKLQEYDIQFISGKEAMKRLTSPSEKECRTLFDNLQQLKNTYKYNARNIYNMDESWVTCGDSADKHLYLTHNKSVPEVGTKESPKHVSVVTCVNVHGNMIQNVYLSDSSPPPIGLFDDVHADYPGHIKCPRGFMNGDGLEEWVEKFFLPSVTPHMKPEEYGLLIVDAHSSRKTEMYKNLLEEKNFHLLVLPARTTRFFQPLDLSVFGSLKHYYSKEGGSSNPHQCMVKSQLAFKEIRQSSITAGWDKSRLLNDTWESFSEGLDFRVGEEKEPRSDSVANKILIPRSIPTPNEPESGSSSSTRSGRRISRPKR